MPEDKNKSTVDFLNEIASTPPELFKEEETEEPVVEEEEEKPLPFHKDPKVQRYVERQIEKALEGRPSAEREFREAVDDIKLPSSFVKLIGNDTPEKVEVLKDLSTYFGNLKGEARAEFLEEMQEQQNRATQEDIKAQNELDDYFEEIEETFNVDISSNTPSAKQTRSSFIDYVRKIAPKNEDGEVSAFPDLVSSFEEFQERNKRTSQPTRAKELASRGMTRSSDANQSPKTGNSWKDVDRYFAKLKSEN